MATTGFKFNHTPQAPTRNLDRWLHAQWSRLSGGLSLNAVQLAFVDWGLHVMNSPAQSMTLAQETWQRTLQLCISSGFSDAGINLGMELPEDHRFDLPQWQRWPWRVYRDAFVIAHDLVTEATTGVRGVSTHHQQVVNFTCHQLLDVLSPANFAISNPLVLEKTLSTGGLNLLCGARNLWDDTLDLIRNKPPAADSNYRVGINVAITPGAVIYRNRLIELIQYEPQTDLIKAAPVLIVPAWIMKYYILDLSPHNSLVKYLVDHGHTVFMISWINPTETDRDISMDDYLQLGVMAAIRTLSEITREKSIHTVGYCLGGTLLAIAAAAMGRDKDKRIASMTLLAAQTDFTEPGDLGLFIDESQVTLLEDSMWEIGYLDHVQMAGSFKITNSNDRVWAIMMRDYLMGERRGLSDLATWNLDTTRLPYRMHTEYLRHLYLRNDLAQGRYLVDNQPVSLSDITCPIFCVGAEADTVAPWRSVYKVQLYTFVESTFLLSSGGHNVGIVNPPGVADRHYRMQTRHAEAPWVSPDDWVACTAAEQGSWWPAWQHWLAEHSPNTLPAAQRQLLASCPQHVCPAPGTYVMQK
jgi:polyhydroxyalkanoate synthase